MEQGDQRLDAGGQQRVDEALVEVEAGLVEGAGPGRAGSAARRRRSGRRARRARPSARCRPRSGGSGRRRRRRCWPSAIAPGPAGEGVPDRRPPPVLARRAFDLVGGGGEAPAEAGREPLRESGRIDVERGRRTHLRMVCASGLGAPCGRQQNARRNFRPDPVSVDASTVGSVFSSAAPSGKTNHTGRAAGPTTALSTSLRPIGVRIAILSTARPRNGRYRGLPGIEAPATPPARAARTRRRAAPAARRRRRGTARRRRSATSPGRCARPAPGRS